MNGVGVPYDYAKAAYWFNRATTQGYAAAQGALGYDYYAGQGVPQDYARSMHWLKKAAAKGYTDAQELIGDEYFNGLGMPKDDAKAAYWYKKAAALGDHTARRELERLNVHAASDYEDAQSHKHR